MSAPTTDLPSPADRRRRFTELHAAGTFLLVNVTDAASAAAAEAGGAAALGTTSSGLARMLGLPDGAGVVTLDLVLPFVRAISGSCGLPLSVDAEDGWSAEPAGVAESIHALAEAGAAGASIEDWSGEPGRGLFDTDLAVARVAAAVEAAGAHPGFVVCGRSEGWLRDASDPETMALERLRRFADVGAHCVYAPGPTDPRVVSRLVACSDAPLNVLAPVGPDGRLAIGLDELAERGVRRVSLGGSLHREQQRFLTEAVAAILGAH